MPQCDFDSCFRIGNFAKSGLWNTSFGMQVGFGTSVTAILLCREMEWERVAAEIDHEDFCFVMLSCDCRDRGLESDSQSTDSR